MFARNLGRANHCYRTWSLHYAFNHRAGRISVQSFARRHHPGSLIDAAEGSEVALEKVLLVQDGDSVRVGWLIGILILLTCGKQYTICDAIGSRVLRDFEILELAPPGIDPSSPTARMTGCTNLEQKGNSSRETLQLGEIDQWQFCSKKV